MPFGIKPECVKCHKNQSPLWKSTSEGSVCEECFVADKASNGPTKTEETAIPSNSKCQDTGPKIATRRSARNTKNYKTRLNPYAHPKPLPPKGKGRRFIFKKTCTKAPSAVATPVTSDYVFYKGSYYQVGDIVSMRDVEGGLYYAQIRGLLTDQYCEKSCVITWLIPTQTSPPPEESFDPCTYIIGPEEDVPRRLDCMEFVMHAPSDYFKARNTPYPPVGPSNEDGPFVWTRLTPRFRAP